MAYFDIGDIVADEERLPCTFQIGAELIGYLDPTNDDEVSTGNKGSDCLSPSFYCNPTQIDTADHSELLDWGCRDTHLCLPQF